MSIVSLNRIAEVINKLEQLEVQHEAVEDMKQLDRTTKRIEALVTSSEKMEIHDESTKLWIAELSEVCSEAQDLVDEVEYETVRDQAEQKEDDDDLDRKRMKKDAKFHATIAEVISKLEQLQVHSEVVEDLKQLRGTYKRIEAIQNNEEKLAVDDESTLVWLDKLSKIASEAHDLVDELACDIVEARADGNDNDDGLNLVKKNLNLRCHLGFATKAKMIHRKFDDACMYVQHVRLIKKLKVKGTGVVQDLKQLEHANVQAQIDFLDSKTDVNPGYKNLPLLLADVITDRTKEINERFDEICESRQYLMLTSEDGARMPEYGPKYPLTTTHIVPTFKVYGREDEKKEIVDWLFSGTTSNKLAVFSIVGKGGLGKTTVAQLVYNDRRVSGFFNAKIWICVSLDFDIVKMTREMMEAVTSEPCTFPQLDILQDSLRGKLAGKNILLVLDDVWNLHKDLWESFITPFLYRKQLVRIIVTSRDEAICSIMEAEKLYRLGYLPIPECWELFKSRAFNGRNSGEFPHLEDIGMKIVRKSGGLPLVVKSLGSILQDSADEERWNEVLESKLWELEEDNVVLPILHLSYYYLPTNLKPCFLSCAVFPKDYELVKDEVVHLWISLGYIQKNILSLEHEGNACFDELHRRSFFDVAQKMNFLREGEIFKMHDSIHELASHISANSFSASSTNYLQSMRRSRALIYDNSFRVSFQPLTVNVKHLRFLVLNTVYRLPKDLPHLYNLRVLIITGFAIMELPQGIGDLINLLYLRLCISSLKELPKSICRLYNLETLEVSGSKIRRLQSNISNLCNLRNLSLTDSSVMQLPIGFGKLLKLERLEFYQYYDDPDVNVIRELKNLVNLQGTLCIFNIKDIPNIEYAQEANLKNKPKIDDLRLSWNASYDRFYRWSNLYGCSDGKHLHLLVSKNAFMQTNKTMKTEEDVLDSLQPHTNLRSLMIIDYSGVRFSSWLGDSSFIKLTKILLFKCQVSVLPTLGQLPVLQYLQINEFLNVKSIGWEFLRNLPLENVAFPSLLKLEFHHLPRWEEWHGVQNQDFPQLQELIIKRCPLLTTFSSHIMRNLNSFVSDAYKKVDIVGEIKFLKNLVELGRGLSIFGLRSILKAKEAEQANLKIKHQLSRLALNFGFQRTLQKGLGWEVCSHQANDIYVEANNIQADVLEGLQPHYNLCKLLVYEYGDTSFPCWVGNPSFTKLSHLVISGCDNMNFTCLPTLGQLPSLVRLKIQEILHLKTIGFGFCRFSASLNDNGNAFPSLKELDFIDMPELETWIGVLHADFPKLERLRIVNCPKLAKVPIVPSSVWVLCLLECSNLKVLHLAPDNVYSSELIEVVLQNCVKLEILTGKHNLYNNSMKFYVHGCPMLELDPKTDIIRHELVEHKFEDHVESQSDSETDSSIYFWNEDID